MAERPPPTRADELLALAGKYETLAALRRAKQRGEPPPAREALRELTARFPGALYELDTLPLEVIDERATALRRASERLHAEPAPSWMTWMARYHALVRDELAARRSRRRTGITSPRATVLAIQAIAREARVRDEEVELALFARRRRGVSR